MEIKEILNLIALIVAPLIAVLVGSWLQDRAERRKDKMQIFKTLMTSRIYAWTPDSVNALNTIDVVFADDEKVKSAWKELNEKYRVSELGEQQLKDIEDAQYKLLDSIADSLGYKGKISQKTIQTPYIPNGMARQIEIQTKTQQAYFDALDGVNRIVQKKEKSTGDDSSI